MSCSSRNATVWGATSLLLHSSSGWSRSAAPGWSPQLGRGRNRTTLRHLLLRRLIDSFAEYERLIISARTRSALEAKRRRGERVSGSVPFGYSLAADGRTLAPNTVEERTIRDIRSLRAEGSSMVDI